MTWLLSYILLIVRWDGTENLTGLISDYNVCYIDAHRKYLTLDKN